MAISHSQPKKTPKGLMNSIYSPTFVISWDIGFVMIMIGVVGFFSPHFFGLDLSFMHNLVLVSFGALAVLSGMAKRSTAYKINLFSGIFFILNAVLGALVGDRGHLTLGYGTREDLIVKFAPGFLELSTFDHVFHLSLGLFFLFQAYSWKKKSLNPAN